MPLDPRAARLLDMLALSAAKIESAAQRRDSFAKLMAMAERPGPALAVSTIALADVQARLYRPVAGACPVLLFLHGGGLVAGNLDTHDSLCRRLALAGGFAVASLDYRLAPDHRFPAALDDARAALRALAADGDGLGLDATRLAIGGDSAGALLAALLAAEAPVPLRAQLLLCPVVDLARSGGSAKRSPRAI
jgi:acetyl esterase/lipase